MPKDFTEMSDAEKIEHAAKNIAESKKVDDADLKPVVHTNPPGFDDPTPTVQSLQNKILALTSRVEALEGEVFESGAKKNSEDGLSDSEAGCNDD